MTSLLPLENHLVLELGCQELAAGVTQGYRGGCCDRHHHRRLDGQSAGLSNPISKLDHHVEFLQFVHDHRVEGLHVVAHKQ
jgi:hypothetical protein